MRNEGSLKIHHISNSSLHYNETEYVGETGNNL